jgi:hypothetical protein
MIKMSHRVARFPEPCMGEVIRVKTDGSANGARLTGLVAVNSSVTVVK